MQHRGINNIKITTKSIKNTTRGCEYALASSATSLIAAQNAPTLAFASTSAHNVECALIFEKNTGSLQLLRSHASFSKRIQALLYAVYRALSASRHPPAKTAENNMVATMPCTLLHPNETQ
jgi:hypothetical protein